VEVLEKRMTVKDTDIGKDLLRQIDELQALINAYKAGTIKERDQVIYGK